MLYEHVGVGEEELQWRRERVGRPRKHPFNAVMSLNTNPVRHELVAFLKESSNTFKDLIEDAVVQFSDKWFRVPTEKSGHLNVQEFFHVVEESHFTLCPPGHNVEQYRIYEAAYLGSIPVLFENYTPEECPGALNPFKETGAPFLFAKDYQDGFQKMREYLRSSEESKKKRQREVMRWFDDFLRLSATTFTKEVASACIAAHNANRKSHLEDRDKRRNSSFGTKQHRKKT